MNRLEVENRLDKLARALQRYQQTNHEQFEQATLQQARLNKMLADLDSRLRSVEIAASKQTTEAGVSDREWSKPQTRLN